MKNSNAWLCPRCRHFEEHAPAITTVSHRCPQADGRLTPLTGFTRQAFDALAPVTA